MAHGGHGHRQAHPHGEGHTHEGRKDGHANRRRLVWAFGIGLVVMGAEVWVGLSANALVVLTDAAHYFADVSALGLALLAVSWSARPATKRKSFGWYRAEVVAAFVNALFLWALVAAFTFEAYRRFRSPPDIEAGLVIGIGVVTLVANAGTAALLHRGASENINVRAAYMHVVSDALGSVAVIGAGGTALATGWRFADPVFTMVVVALLARWAWSLTGETMHILLEGTPPHIDVDDVRAAIRAVPGVEDVHDLHIWMLTSGVESCSAHLVPALPRADSAVDERRLRDAVRVVLHERFGMDHVTLEVEAPGGECLPGETQRARHA